MQHRLFIAFKLTQRRKSSLFTILWPKLPFYWFCLRNLLLTFFWHYEPQILFNPFRCRQVYGCFRAYKTYLCYYQVTGISRGLSVTIRTKNVDHILKIDRNIDIFSHLVHFVLKVHFILKVNCELKVHLL